MYLGKSNMAPELVANASFGFDARFLPLRAAFGGLGIPWRSVAKRGFDIAVSLFLLVVFASWLFPLVALWIRLDSPGPAFFRQRRIGLNGREFELWKFRRMRVHDAPKGICPQATRQDARVTRVGAWLRRFSVDEFPQMFNVLKGEMSLVGPRPHAPGTCAGGRRFEDVVAYYQLRHRGLPGMTGLAQVRGWRGETDTEDKLVNRVQSDFEYICNWSLRLDLLILLRTVGALASADAY